MATIREVADRAGVAVSTVSKVLNRPDFGSEATRQKVMAAVRELGYRPNSVARSLVKRRSDTLGLVIPDLLNPVFPAVAHAVERSAREVGFSLVLGTTDRSAAVERQYLELFQENKADGVIFFAALSAGNIEALQRQGIPVVIIERPSGIAGTDLVKMDNRQGGYLATRHLIDRGARRIGLIVGPLPGEIEEERLAGYRQALEEAGLPFEPELVQTSDYTIPGGAEATARLLDRAAPMASAVSSPCSAGRAPVDAIFAACDIMAVGTLRELERRGLQVPADVLLIGFDDTLSQYTTPPLSTVAQPFEQLGREAVRLLVERVRGGRRGQFQQVILPARLVVRESTGGSTSSGREEN